MASEDHDTEVGAWCAWWRLFAWDLTKYFAGLTLYNNIIVYVLPYIYYYDHRPAANGFRGFYVKTIYKLYGMGDLWRIAHGWKITLKA